MQVKIEVLKPDTGKNTVTFGPKVGFATEISVVKHKSGLRM
jgi:hypothetical protein